MNTPENGDGPGASGAAVQASLSTSPAPDTVAPGSDERQTARSPYLCVEDVAARYHSTARTVREWARLGQLPHLRRPNSRRLLFLESELEALDGGAELELSDLPGGGRRVRVVQ